WRPLRRRRRRRARRTAAGESGSDAWTQPNSRPGEGDTTVSGITSPPCRVAIASIPQEGPEGAVAKTSATADPVETKRRALTVGVIDIAGLGAVARSRINSARADTDPGVSCRSIVKRLLSTVPTGKCERDRAQCGPVSSNPA